MQDASSEKKKSLRASYELFDSARTSRNLATLAVVTTASDEAPPRVCAVAMIERFHRNRSLLWTVQSGDMYSGSLLLSKLACIQDLQPAYTLERKWHIGLTFFRSPDITKSKVIFLDKNEDNELKEDDNKPKA